MWRESSPMYRVLASVLGCLLLVGCSTGDNSSLSAGLADSGQATSALPSTRLAGSSASASDATPKRVANAEDLIPKGTYEKAPSGALADRDYSATQLDPEKARELINSYRKQKGLKPLKLNAAL